MTNAEFCRRQEELINEGRKILFSVVSPKVKNKESHEEIVIFNQKDENGKICIKKEKLDFKVIKSCRVLIIDVQSTITDKIDTDFDSVCFDIMLKSNPQDWLSIVSAYNFCCLHEKIICSICNGKQSVEISEFFNKEYYKDGKIITQEELQESLLKYFEIVSKDNKTIVIRFNG